MSNQDQPINFGADATENNLAGTRDEFNDEVTAQLLEEAKAEEREKPVEDKEASAGNEASDDANAEDREEREEQPALELDEDSPASEAEPSS